MLPASCRLFSVSANGVPVNAEARAIGRSLTEVSIPVTDCWLDQYPGRLFLLATYLAGGAGAEAGHSRGDVIRGWMQSRKDFEQATKAYNLDGVLLVIEELAAILFTL